MERIHQITNSIFPTTSNQSSSIDSSMFQMFFQQFHSSQDDEIQLDIGTTSEYSELEQSVDENSLSNSNNSKESPQTDSSQVQNEAITQQLTTFTNHDLVDSQPRKPYVSTNDEHSHMTTPKHQADSESLPSIGQKNSNLNSKQDSPAITNFLGKVSKHEAIDLSKNQAEPYSSKLPENKERLVQNFSASETPMTEVVPTEKGELPTLFSADIALNSSKDSNEKINSLSSKDSMEANTVEEERQFNLPIANSKVDELAESRKQAVRIAEHELPKLQKLPDNQLKQPAELVSGASSQIANSVSKQVDTEITIAPMSTVERDISEAISSHLSSNSEPFIWTTNRVAESEQKQSTTMGIELEIDELPTSVNHPQQAISEIAKSQQTNQPPTVFNSEPLEIAMPLPEKTAINAIGVEAITEETELTKNVESQNITTNNERQLPNVTSVLHEKKRDETLFSRVSSDNPIEKSISNESMIDRTQLSQRTPPTKVKDSLINEQKNIENNRQTMAVATEEQSTESNDKKQPTIIDETIPTNKVTNQQAMLPVREAGTLILDIPKLQNGHDQTLEKVVQEIAKPIQQELQTLVRPNEKIVTFDLDSGNLGKVQVKMKVTPQSVSLELTVQSEQTKKIFEAITTRLDKVLQKQENVPVFTVTRSEPTNTLMNENQASLSQSFQQGFSQERPMQQQRNTTGRYRKNQLEEKVVEHEVESHVSILA